mmetsp:Transcript_41226/g.132522  ORF Transcript_41226/g.132522 Transcript_41226/m.132522 type:complete len:218 (+) Transcript_41226:336-989(+)
MGGAAELLEQPRDLAVVPAEEDHRARRVLPRGQRSRKRRHLLLGQRGIDSQPKALCSRPEHPEVAICIVRFSLSGPPGEDMRRRRQRTTEQLGEESAVLIAACRAEAWRSRVGHLVAVSHDDELRRSCRLGHVPRRHGCRFTRALERGAGEGAQGSGRHDGGGAAECGQAGERRPAAAARSNRADVSEAWSAACTVKEWLSHRRKDAVQRIGPTMCG